MMISTLLQGLRESGLSASVPPQKSTGKPKEEAAFDAVDPSPPDTLQQIEDQQYKAANIQRPMIPEFMNPPSDTAFRRYEKFIKSVADSVSQPASRSLDLFE
jgi:hypothetical protein